MLQLAIVIPTYNEQANVGPLVEKINAALGSINWEIIFVDDDSNDGTPEKLQTLALNDSRVRYIRSVGRHGLYLRVCLVQLLQ
jgi:dolichol-phosphate mannosyltransferase